MDRDAIERQLAECRSFSSPDISLEQYATPPDIGAHLVHLAALQGDLTRPVVDLGTGTGVLAIGAVLAGAEAVVGVELDRNALKIARDNADRLGLEAEIQWVQGVAESPGLCVTESPTVLANPPFGAVNGSAGADRTFLSTAAAFGGVSYTLHNAGSHGFVSAFAEDHGGTVTRAYEAAFDIPRTFSWHDRDRATVTVEVIRIEW